MQTVQEFLKQNSDRYSSYFRLIYLPIISLRF